MVLNWRSDQDPTISGADSGNSGLAKTRDHHIRSESGSYAFGRQQSVIGRKDDVITYNDYVGLQTGRRNSSSCDHSERVVFSDREECGSKYTTPAVLNAPSSSGKSILPGWDYVIQTNLNTRREGL
jgi:hypothetical protein